MRIALKIGGSVLEPAPAPELMGAVARTRNAGHEVLLIHGGGKALNALLRDLGIGSEFKQGLRVTGPETLRAALMAFAGEVNTGLVAALNRAGVRAVGLTGCDAEGVVAQRERPELGAVGTQASADPRLALTLLAAGFTPVYAPLASDGAGGVLNVNADQFAAAVAAAAGAERLYFVTDVPGVLDPQGATMPQVTLAELESMAAGGAIHGGMLPKADACRAALQGGVARVEIIGAAAAVKLDALCAQPGAAASTGTRVRDDVHDGAPETAGSSL